jgi:hypothetical protein
MNLIHFPCELCEERKPASSVKALWGKNRWICFDCQKRILKLIEKVRERPE